MPPVNDNTINAIALSLSGGTISGTTTAATSETTENSQWKGANVPTVWYYYHNATASGLSLLVSNLISTDDTNWGGPFDGPEIDLWNTPVSPPATWDNLFNYDDPGDHWINWLAASPFHSSPLSSFLSIPPGYTGYVEVGNYDWNATEFGPFSFDYEFITPPANDNVYDAIALSGSGTITGDTTGAGSEPLENSEWKGDPVPTVWYYYHNNSGSDKVVNISNLIEISSPNWDDGPYIGVWMTPQNVPGTWEQQFYFDSDAGNYFLLDLYTYSPAHDFLVPDGMTLYVEVSNQDWDDTDAGAFSFDYSISNAPNFPIISQRHGS